MTEEEARALARFFSSWSLGHRRTLAPGITTCVFWGEKLMLSFVEVEPNTESPLHSHPEEQWGVLLEGEWERTQGGESRLMRRGDFWYTPGGVEHGGHTFDKPARILDIFSPPRTQYME